MVRIIIAEDDPLYAAQLKQFLHDFSRESGQVFQITCYDNGEDLVEQYKPEYDLLLLDVEMPFINGMQAAKEIRRVDPRVIIIFITNLAQYAIQGYSVNALDYILKPLEYTSFSLHLSRALSYLKQQDDPHMSIAVRGGMVKLKVESIYYIESLDDLRILHTQSGSFESYTTLNKLEQVLAEHSFFRCGKSYLINLAYVEAYQDHCAVVYGERIPVSQPKRAKFIEALNQYMGDVIR